jgi:hypothetical protein
VAPEDYDQFARECDSALPSLGLRLPAHDSEGHQPPRNLGLRPNFELFSVLPFLTLRWHPGHVQQAEGPEGPSSSETASAPVVGDQPSLTPPTAETPAASPGAPPGYGPGSFPGYGPPPGQAPPPWYGWAGWPPTGPWASPSGPYRSGFSRVLHSALAAWIVAGVLALAVVGLSVDLATQSTQSPASAHVVTPFGGPGTQFKGPGFFGRGLGNLAVAGTVASVGTGTFTVTATSGQTVTVDEQSSTTYESGGSSASSSVVVKGARVVVQGTRSGNTVTATSVVVLPAGGFGAGGQGPGQFGAGRGPVG